MTPDNETLRKWAEAVGVEWSAEAADGSRVQPHVYIKGAGWVHVGSEAVLPLIAERLMKRAMEGGRIETVTNELAHRMGVDGPDEVIGGLDAWEQSTAAQRAAAAYAVLKKTPPTEHAADTD